MTLQLHMGEVEEYFFILWLSDNVDTLSVVGVRVRPERRCDNPFTLCEISSTTWFCCSKKKKEIFISTVTPFEAASVQCLQIEKNSSIIKEQVLITSILLLSLA